MAQLDLHEMLLELRAERNMATQVGRMFRKPELIPELIQIVNRQEPYPFAEYGSWLLMHLAKKNKKRTGVFYEKIVDLLFLTDNETVLRNCSSAIRTLPFQSYRDGERLELLLGFLGNVEHKVALHAYSLYQLIPYVKQYPELNTEIKALLDLHEQRKPALEAALKKFVKATKPRVTKSRF